MTIENYVKSAEAIIFASGDGVTGDSLKAVLDIDDKELQYVIDTLKEKYSPENSGVVLISNSENICFTTNKDNYEDVQSALSAKKGGPLSNAAMETLAIIAYNQPVSRAFIEQVRGVDSTSSVQTLVQRGLVEEAGRLDIPGHPISYKTTALFLRSFSLDSVADLPKVRSEKTEGQLSTDDIVDEEMENDIDN